MASNSTVTVSHECCPTALDVTAPGDGLMSAAPPRPVQYLGRRVPIPRRQADQEPAQLRDAHGHQFVARSQIPFLTVLVASKASASSASVMWRYHPAHDRTS